MSESTSALPPDLEFNHPHEVWIIQPSRRRLWLHVVLLLATFVSTVLVGTRIEDNFEHSRPAFSLSNDSELFPVELVWQAPTQLLAGLPFSLTLMFILLAHEMGHYLYARHYRVHATLPYFIPFPSLIGTLGAFIRIKSPIRSQAALFDIGIAGPIAGFIPACAAVFGGLYLSTAHGSTMASSNQIGFPLAFQAAARMLHIHRPLSALPLHPIAVAGWVGMFATAMNLLPGGQFDGGHILYSAFPRAHRLLSLATVLALIPMATHYWVGWLIWATFLWLTHVHPPVPAIPGIDKGRKWIAVAGIAMLLLSFSPAPIKEASGREVWPQMREAAGALRVQGQQAFHDAVQSIRQRLHRK